MAPEFCAATAAEHPPGPRIDYHASLAGLRTNLCSLSVGGVLGTMLPLEADEHTSIEVAGSSEIAWVVYALQLPWL